ncbi:uncharacterized protein LOC131245111 isoform X3 [Magnolia sinica]|uniref:uncharacterized protein LOC131245111 isoform X3 n=1 Tax=Magnolia sinica TaxID=86752 RepID=UPI00265AD62E|nr:uncharacterized protein LOC131245111 isoform X3 [Magnolia sinica]
MNLPGLSAICAGLGFAEEDENGIQIGYTKSELCLDNLKDLQRFLRRDDPQTRDVFKQVCKWNTVSQDLIPIIEQYQNDRNLVINAVKVLVFLTMPIDPASSDISQQIEYLWTLKKATTRNDTIAVIVSLLEDPLEHLEREAFTEDDWKLVQLVVTLFRNILAIQEISLQQKASGSATQFLCLRDRFLELLFHENVMDLIIVLTQHVAGSCGYLREDNLLLLETFHYIFLGQDPELIAKASQKGSKLQVDGDIKTSINSLQSMMEEEEEKRRLIRLRNLDRHSQFSGTFTRLAMDGSKSLFKGNPAAASCDGLLKAHKVQRGPLKRIAWDHGSLSLPKENILELLHNFVNQFLSGGYNVLMQSIREDIEKEHHAIQSSDVIVFFEVAHFVTAFQHHKFSISKSNMESSTSEASFVNKNADSTLFRGDACGPIAATMNEAMFLLVISKWREAFDGLKETKAYKFLSAAGSLMKGMIHMLDLVLKLLPEDSKEPQTARILLYKIFYDQTDQGMTQFLVNQIRSFDAHKQSKSDLADLVEVIHIVLRLMENLQARGTLRVSKKSRKARKKIQGNKNVTEVEKMVEEDVSAPKADGSNHHIANSTREQVEKMVEEDASVPKADDSSHDIANSTGEQVEKMVEEDASVPKADDSSHEIVNSTGEQVEKMVEEDASVPKADDSSHDIANSTGEQVEKMVEEDASVPKADDSSHGIANSIGDPVVDLNNSTEDHLEKSSNGKEESSSVPCQTEEPEMPSLDACKLGDDSVQMDNEKADNGLNDLAYGTGDSSDDDQLPAMNEVDFSVYKLVATFANNTIIQNLCWLLKFYKSNSSSTNHYIMSMLRRICEDLELAPMLYQLSLLTTFYDILRDQKSYPCKEYENIVSFLTKLVRKLMKKMKSQPLLFVEVLFWKTRKECHYINSEFLLHELGNLKKESCKWGSMSVEEEESDTSNGEGGLARRSLADALGEDEHDFVISQEINHQTEDNASIRNIPKALHKTKDDHSSWEHESQKASKRRKSLVFDEDQEKNIKNLYEKYKDNRQCSHLIAEALDPDGKVSPSQVSCKLKQLGLKVASKKKMPNVDEPFSGGDDQVRAGHSKSATSAQLPSNELENGSLPRNSFTSSRKRIQAFSKEQEMMVKDLFEQFKSHKKCSHMIANALDADNTYTAAQVSRKLRQLGLRVPQKKRQLEATYISGQDGKDLVDTDSKEPSDEEASMSLKERYRNKRQFEATNLSGQDDAKDSVAIDREEPSDEETLLSLKERRKGKVSSKLVNKEATTNGASKRKFETTLSHEDDGDDEILSAIFNGKKVPPKPKGDKLKTPSVQETASGNESATRAPVIERYDISPSSLRSHAVNG